MVSQNVMAAVCFQALSSNNAFRHAFIDTFIMTASPPYLGRLPIWVTVCVSHCECHILCVTLCASHFVCHIMCITVVDISYEVLDWSTVTSTVRLMAVPLAKRQIEIIIGQNCYYLVKT